MLGFVAFLPPRNVMAAHVLIVTQLPWCRLIDGSHRVSWISWRPSYLLHCQSMVDALPVVPIALVT